MSLLRLKEAIDLRELAREYGEFKVAGKDLTGRCLFHDERTASFRVHREFAKCFGCQWSGDCFTFLAAIEGISLGAAMRMLSDRTGIPLDDYKPLSRVHRVLDGEEREFCEWWRKRKVAYGERRLTCYVKYAGRGAVTIGEALKALREMTAAELRQHVARTATLAERAAWQGDRQDAAHWAEVLVATCAVSVEIGTRTDLMGG